MPAGWRILDDGILEVYGSGVVAEAEYLKAHDEWFALPMTGVTVARTLADWSAVTRLELRAEAIRQSVRMTRDHVTRAGIRGRMAMVASSPAIYGLCRMWELLFEGSPVEVAVFHDREEALTWLRR